MRKSDLVQRKEAFMLTLSETSSSRFINPTAAPILQQYGDANYYRQVIPNVGPFDMSPLLYVFGELRTMCNEEGKKRSQTIVLKLGILLFDSIQWFSYSILTTAFLSFRCVVDNFICLSENRLLTLEKQRIPSVFLVISISVSRLQRTF
jgi:hypothetical protein